MLEFRLRLTTAQQKSLTAKLKLAQQLGRVQGVKRILAILSLGEGRTIADVATMLKISDESVRLWLEGFLLKGLRSLQSKHSPGRPPKLNKEQKRELIQIIDQPPNKSGFSSAVWRSPMIQHLIKEKYGIDYSTHYISQLLHSLGFSFQKARFVSDHIDKQKRQEWLEKSWPKVLRLAKRKRAYLLFGDEASFPQWGTLSYTWARKGQQPEVKTSGKRRSYKVFGLIDYFTGSFFYKCIQGRLCSQSYQEFLIEILAKTRKHIFLIQDQARYHTSEAMRLFFANHSNRLTVIDLPSYSPDFNPIEKLWKKIKQNHTHLHYFPSFDSLISKVDFAMLDFIYSPDEILSLFGFYNSLAA